MTKKISADQINPHDVIVVGGIARKVSKIIRRGYPTVEVEITVVGDRASMTVEPYDQFEYLGDARIIGNGWKVSK